MITWSCNKLKLIKNRKRKKKTKVNKVRILGRLYHTMTGYREDYHAMTGY